MKKPRNTKFCAKCRTTKPLNAENFYRNGPWLSAPCKPCKRADTNRRYHEVQP